MEIELYSKLNDPIAAIKSLGTMFAKSGMFGCEKEEQGQVLAMICLSERKSPVAITTNYDIVEGKLRKKALAALADFRSAGGKHKWLASGDTPAVKDEDRFAELELTDREGVKVTYRYSMADARAEGLVKDRSRWVKRPGNMLRARCISNGLGMICPEIFAGEDDNESPETEPKPLLRETAPATVKAEPKKPENVIDVPSTIVSQTEPKSAEVVPPVSAPVEESKVVYTEADIELDAGTQRLTVKALGALEWAIGEENLARAILWMKRQTPPWIENSLSECSVERARRLFKALIVPERKASFIQQITPKAQ